MPRIKILLVTIILLVTLLPINKVQGAECDITVNPGESIQQGIDSASSGQTVCVEYGTYVEAININKAITLKGIPNPQGQRPTIDGEHRLPNNSNGPKNPRDPSIESTYEPLVNMSSSNSTVDGFILHRSKGRGIRIWNSTQTISNISVINNKISNAYMNGIIPVGENSSIRVSDVLIKNNEIYYAASFAPFVRSSYVVDWGAAISVKWSDNVTIENNYIHEIWGEGILADANTGNDTNIVIKNNILHDIMRPSVYIHGNINTFEITNNHIYSTNAEPNGPGDWNAGLVIVDTEPQYTSRGNPKHSPTNGVVKNNKVEIENYFEGGINLVIENNNAAVTLVEPVGLLYNIPSPTTAASPTPQPTPSISPTFDPKFDLDENGVVNILDVLEVIKYIFR